MSKNVDYVEVLFSKVFSVNIYNFDNHRYFFMKHKMKFIGMKKWEMEKFNVMKNERDVCGCKYFP